MFQAFWGFDIYGLENIPSEGGFIFASNHESMLDPPLIGAAATTRYARYMAKHTLFKPGLGWLISSLGAFPIKRGTVDRDADRTFARLISEGDAIVVFPEGTRTKNGKLQEPKAGIGKFVYQTRAPVIPVYVRTFPIWPYGKKVPSFFGVRNNPEKRAVAKFGKPVNLRIEFAQPAERDTYNSIARKIMIAIRKRRDDDIR
jgi:1-acyl-sn-glycerol-3-phosphate acyltransferase